MPRQALLAAQPWRIGEHGEISAQACQLNADLDEIFTSGKVPLCAAIAPTFTEASHPKEIQELLKFGRDSARPLKITAPSTIDDTESLSITYDSDWTDCDGYIA
jgi:hypothetical protein